MSYTKLFSSIITSTIWTEDAQTCKAWVTLLALADKNGEVQASIPGLAQVAAIPVEAVERAIEKFLSPDKYSRTPDDEGRRIEVIPGGWALINHSKYRDMQTDDDRRMQAAERQRRKREKEIRNGTCHALSRSVTQCHEKSRQIPQAEAEAEADTEAEREREEGARAPQPPPDLTEIMPTGAAADMIALQKRIQNVKPAWKLALTYEEQQSMMRNGSCLASLDDADWKRITEYMNAKLPEGAGYWQPKSRGKFIESLPDVHSHACRWETANGNAPKRKGWT